MANFNYNSPEMLLSFGIPTPTSQAFTYAAAGAANDDLVATITYKNAVGTTLGVLEFAYVGATNNILTITRTS